MLANANPKNKISGSKEKNFDKASVREKYPTEIMRWLNYII